MTIIELKSISDFSPIYPLIKQLNSELSESDFNDRLKKMLVQGYRCIAIVKNGQYLGVCGFWQGTRFWCGDFIDLDNLVVDERYRGKNIGKKLIKWVENLAINSGCSQIGLDSYVNKHDANRFYFHEGYIIKGYHFVKSLEKNCE